MHLSLGVYREHVRTVRDGRADAPIVVKGPEQGFDRTGRHQAVLFAEGRVFSVNHSQYVLKARERGPERDRYHNGEGVYIGTSPESLDQPMYADDQSSYNIVRDNRIRPFGSECFNVKENAHHNVMEGNSCSGNVEGVEYSGSNVERRGHGNVVRNNRIADSAGAAVKIRSDEARYDKGGNTVTANKISAAVVALQLVSDARQGPICGNTVGATVRPHDSDPGPASGAVQPRGGAVWSAARRPAGR